MMRTPAQYLTFILLLLSTACENTGRDPEKFHISGHTMGTQYSISIREDIPVKLKQTLQTAVEQNLASINQIMSTYDPQSELSQLNESSSSSCQTISKPLFTVIESALGLSIRSNGAFDITVGPLVNLWGFGPDGSKQQIPTNKQINNILSKVGYRYIELDKEKNCLRKLNQNLYIDLSAIAKGYAIDSIATQLKSMNIGDYLIEIGGDLRASSNDQQWRIAIEQPDKTLGQSIHRIIKIRHSAVATSGDYRNYFSQDGRHYSHIIDPSLGTPVQHTLASVTVLHESAMMADGIATSLLVMGPEQGLEHAEANGIAALFILHRNDAFETQTTSHFLKMQAD